ncbi:MAG: diguanylate cyclase, partial [Pseudomonadota bacterium]
RRLTLAYVVALVLLATTACSAHFVQKRAIKLQYRDAEVVNVAGRQRMLLQRIAWSVAGLPAAGNENISAAGARLDGALALLLESHERLSRGDLRWNAADPAAGDLREHYFAGAQSLDLHVATFAEQVRSFLALPPGTERNLYQIAIEMQAEGPLLAALDAAVGLHQRDGELKIVALERVTEALLAIMLALLLLEVLLIFRPLVRYIRAQRAELLTLAQTDPLTGCSNRRVFFEISRKLRFADARREQSSALLVLDIDHFKQVNDRYGHTVGDQAICHVVTRILATIRRSDVLGRLGGEEFGVFMPSTSLKEGAIVAEKIRRAIDQHPLPLSRDALPLTVSVGVAEMAAVDAEPGEALSVADQAMYQAKRSGRNRVCLATESLDPVSDTPGDAPPETVALPYQPA